jgi:hypothetical protein
MLSQLCVKFHLLVDRWIWKEVRVVTRGATRSAFSCFDLKMRQLSPLAVADVLSNPGRASCLNILNINDISGGHIDQLLLAIPMAEALQEVR